MKLESISGWKRKASLYSQNDFRFLHQITCLKYILHFVWLDQLYYCGRGKRQA